MLGLKLNYVSKRGHRRLLQYRVSARHPYPLISWDLVRPDHPFQLSNHFENLQWVILPCSVQHFKSIRQPMTTLWANEVPRDLIWRWVSDGYPIVRHPWRRHQMETFSALLATCARNSPVPGEFPAQRPVTLMFSLICDQINCWVNNCEAGNLRRHRVHYDVIGMLKFLAPDVNLIIMLTICRVSGLYPKRWPTNFQDI